MEKKYSPKNKENKNNKKADFCDILSIPSNPEDLFTLLYPIGRGAFGLVYKAMHNSTNEIYAIKIIDYSKDNDRENNYVVNYNYSSIQQETSLMKLVNDSNYVVKYYGSYFSRKSNTLWLILEYCSSGSVIDLMLAMERTFSEVEVATIMEMVLHGLSLIHSKNLIHRDIKGANILLSEDGYAKLGDFGIGTQLLNQKYRQSKKGSPYWMSPQVASNLKYDFKTDIWSLGITCLEILQGEPPFSDMEPKDVIKKLAKNSFNLNEIVDFNEHTYEFKNFIEHCLEVDPVKRYSAEQLLKQDFIRKFSRGRKYMIELIRQHVEDVEKFRFESEEFNKKEINEIKKSTINKIEYFNFEEESEKSGNAKQNCYNESIIIPNSKTSYNNDKDNINNEQEDKEEITENITIDENAFYNRIINNFKTKNNSKNNLYDNEEKNLQNENVKKYLSSFLLTEHNSQKSIVEDNSKELIVEESNNTNCMTIKNSKNIFLFDEINGEKNNLIEAKIHKSIKPFVSKFHNNNLTFINNKDNINENINDSDDEGITNKTNKSGNMFKDVDIYKNE